MSKDSFILYNDMYELIKYLDDQTAGKLIKAIFEYTNNKTIPNDKNIVAVFMFIKKQIDKDTKKYEEVCKKNKINGEKGGRPKINCNSENPKKPTGFIKNPSKPKKPDNDNDNDNDNDINNNKYLCRVENTDIVKKVIDYLNELGKTNYKYTTKKTRELINARIKDGCTIEDLKKLVYYSWDKYIKNKADFNGIPSEYYYRPETIFNNKFEAKLEEYNRKAKNERN